MIDAPVPLTRDGVGDIRGWVDTYTVCVGVPAADVDSMVASGVTVMACEGSVHTGPVVTTL